MQTSQQQWSKRLLDVVDGGLVAILFVAPLFMGGRGPAGRMVFIVLAMLVAIAWCARQCLLERGRWRWTSVEWLLAAGLGVLILQLVSLSQPLLHWLSPAISELLPFWQAGGELQLGAWSQLSLHPAATRSGLAIYVCHGLLFLVVSQRIRGVEDVERLLRWVALAAVGMALLGIGQMLLGNGKFLWIYEHPSRTTHGAVKGTFQNQNHFAHLLVLGVAPLIWWLHRSSSAARSRRDGFSASASKRHASHAPSQTLLLWGGLTAIVLAILLTFSRGGVLMLTVAISTCLAVSYRQSWFGKRSLVGLGAVVVMAGVALSIFGYEPLMARLRTLGEARDLQDLSSGRHALWAALAEAIPQFPLTGTGVGTHADVYRTFMEHHLDNEFTHGESGYLQLLLETGALGFALFLVGAVIALRWCVHLLLGTEDRRLAACGGAIVPGLLASMIHSVADFAWYIPACMSFTVILLASANAARRILNERAHNRAACDLMGEGLAIPRVGWIGLTAVTLLAALWMVRVQMPAAMASSHWESYRKLARLPSEERKQPELVEAMALHLSKTVENNPADARAHAHLAILELQRFDIQQEHSENPMPLPQIRDAALMSQFPSKEAQDAWLARAIGDNRKALDRSISHARRAVELCPMQGEAYVTLAGLAFLESPLPHRKHAYIEQALKVRPYSGLVLYAAGQEAALAGRMDKALEYWKLAFRQDPDVRTELIHLLATQLPLPELLQKLQPDRQGLSELFHYYVRADHDQHAACLAQRLAPLTEREAEATTDAHVAAGLWRQAASHYARLQQPEDSLRCARHAVDIEPSTFEHRIELVKWLKLTEQFEEASQHLEWCLRRKPDDAVLQQQLAEIRKQRLQQAAMPTVVPATATR